MSQTANGCVVTLSDGGQIATDQYTANELVVQLGGGYAPIHTGPDDDHVVFVNIEGNGHVVAVQPANIQQPEEAPTA